MTITTPSGHEFILYENEVVTIDLFSSLFTTDGELKGSYSFSAKAPLLPNKKAINYGDMLEKHTSGMLTDLQVRLGNIYWTNVNMLYEVNNSKEIEFSLTLNLSLINERLKKTLLTEIPFPVHSLGAAEWSIQVAMTIASQNTDWTEIPYTFGPVLAPKFTGGVKDEEAETGVIETSDYVNDMRVEGSLMAFNAPNRLVSSRYKYVVVPYFYLNFVLSTITEWLGFQKGGEVLSDPETSKLVIYNINQAYLPVEGSDMFITASDHLPAISIADFFKSLNDFGIYTLVKINTNELLFRFKRDLFRKPIILDWSDKVSNYENVEPQLYGGYSVKFETPIAAPTADRIEDNIFEGNGETVIKLNISTLDHDVDVDSLPGRGWLIPFDNSDGNVLDPNFSNLNNFTLKKEKKENPIRFLYNNGWMQWQTYPAAPRLTAINYTTLKELFLGGIYSTYLRSFLLATEGAKGIKIDFLLNHNDVAQWKDDDIVMIKSKSGVSISCLLKQLSFDVKRDSANIRARGIGLILNSAFYKPLPNDKLFIKYEITNIISAYPVDECDLVFTLYQNRELTIPYEGSDIVPVDFTINIRTRSLTDYSKITLSSEEIRIVMQSGTFTYHTVLNKFYEDPELGDMLETRSFEIQESSRYYIIA